MVNRLCSRRFSSYLADKVLLVLHFIIWILQEPQIKELTHMLNTHKFVSRPGEISQIKIFNPNCSKNKSYYMNFKLI